MNNRSLFLAALSITLVSAVGCNKDETTTDATGTTSSEVIMATVAKNTTYTYNLSSSVNSSTTYRIVNPSDVGATVDINTVQNVPVYEYVPAADFVGEDLVQVVAITDSTTNGAGCGSGGGRGGNGSVQNTDTLTFQMRVTETGS